MNTLRIIHRTESIDNHNLLRIKNVKQLNDWPTWYVTINKTVEIIISVSLLFTHNFWCSYSSTPTVPDKNRYHSLRVIFKNILV